MYRQAKKRMTLKKFENFLNFSGEAFKCDDRPWCRTETNPAMQYQNLLVTIFGKKSKCPFTFSLIFFTAITIWASSRTSLKIILQRGGSSSTAARMLLKISDVIIC